MDIFSHPACPCRRFLKLEKIRLFDSKSNRNKYVWCLDWVTVIHLGLHIQYFHLLRFQYRYHFLKQYLNNYQ